MKSPRRKLRDGRFPSIDAEGDEPAVLLFTTYSCSACEEIKEYLKDLLEEKDFVLTEVNVAEGENIQLFKELVGAFGRDADDGKSAGRLCR